MLAIKNAKLESISNGRIDNGSILVKDGKILALGENIDLSNCKRIIDGQGRIVTPGIIDSHTHLGLSESGVGQEGRDTNEGTSPLTPLCSVRDGINMKDQAFESFRKAGTTTVGVLPGSGNIIGGTGLALKCKGHIVDESVLKDPIGMKAALGENPAILAEKGVKVCLMTDHPFLNCRYFLQYGAISHKHGLPFDETLKAMTINPAEALGIEDRVGSLEVGKDADFVVLNGEPLSYKGSIQETYIEGKLVWERIKY